VGIITKLLGFSGVECRIKSLEFVDHELLLLTPVYMQMFRLHLKFVGILTRYVRDKELGMSNAESANFKVNYWAAKTIISKRFAKS